MATRKKGTDVALPDDKREFRKTNEAIGLRVKEGRLSLLTRKVLNVLMYHAQEQKAPGVNAPIDTPANRKYFWIPLSDLAKDANYDSKDTSLLKSQLEEMQSIKLVMEDERQWTSEYLVSSVKLVNPAGLHTKHGGRVWLGYTFPPEVHELVMAPGTYTKLSIFYQGLLKSGASLALYEICRRYASNPSRLTNQDTYAHWYVVLTGNPISSEDDLPPYKYFKRDVISKAIAEINALTDINVELVEHKSGRKVEQLQFRVEQAKQGQLEFPVPPVLDSQLLERLTHLGLSQNEAQDLVATQGDEKVRAAVRMTEDRMMQRTAAPLESPLAYFRWALKDGSGAAQQKSLEAADKPAPKPPKVEEGAGKSLMDEFQAARARKAFGAYSDMTELEQGELWSRFKAGSKLKSVKEASGPSGAMLRSLFSTWLAQQWWGEPSASDLAEFIASNRG